MTRQVFHCEQEVHAPLNLVFDVASDRSARLQWMEGTKDGEVLNDRFNRLGTKHRCIVENHNPIMATSGNARSSDAITIAETDDRRTACTVYTFQQEDKGRMRLWIDGFIKENDILRLAFNLLFKKKPTTRFQRSAQNLKRCCEELYRGQRNPSGKG